MGTPKLAYAIVAIVGLTLLGGIPQASAVTLLDTSPENDAGFAVYNESGGQQSIAVEFDVGAATTITGVEAWLTSTSGSGTVVDLGIMADSGGLPSGPFLDSFVTLVPFTTPVNQTVDWSVAAGNYWLVAIAESGFIGSWETNDSINNNCAYDQGGGGWGLCNPSSAPAAIITGADVSATPLPATLPLFATGLGALSLLGWRRKRKAAAIAA